MRKSAVGALPALFLLLLALQELTFWLLVQRGIGYELSALKWLGGSALRLIVEAQLALLLLFFPPLMRAVAGFMLVVLLASAVVLYYESGLLLTATLLTSNWHEGRAALGLGVDFGVMSCLAVAVALGALVLLIWLGSGRRQRWSRRMLAIVLLCLFVDGVMVSWIDPPQRMRSYISKERIMLTYGYPGMFGLESVLLTANHAQTQYESFLQSRSPAHVVLDTPSGFTPSSIYVVQWESLDYFALEALKKGGFVPQLANQLSPQSLRTEHLNGSADTDYAVNTGLPTARHINPYLLNATGHETYLAKAMLDEAYMATFVHCNTKRFFSRFQRIEEFGYQASYWSEEFGRDKNSSSFWGLNDLDCVSKLMQAPGIHQGQFLYFVTLTSHYPYRNIPQTRRSEQNLAQRYLLEIRNTSKAIEKLLAAMPEQSLLVVFGDHRAMGGSLYDKYGEVPLYCGIKHAQRWKNCRFKAFGEEIKPDGIGRALAIASKSWSVESRQH